MPQEQNKEFLIVRVKGPHAKENDEVKSSLLSQLQQIPRRTQSLRIEDDTPSDAEWSILGSHFSNIQDLEMESGYNEEFNDKKLPLHWPIDRLLISSASAELVQTPFIREGKVKHLILLLTCGLRFEGPSTEELLRLYRQAIEKGEKEAQFVTVHEGTPDERKVEITILPELVTDWLKNHYRKLEASQEETDDDSDTRISDSEIVDPKPQDLQFPTETSVRMEKLEIVENDAIDTFDRMALALPHVVLNLSTLNIRSTHNLDFRYTNEELFPQILSQLHGLTILILSVGDIFTRPSLLPELYQKLPENLSILRFRGPISLVHSKQWKNWIESFASSEYLPNLKILSFVLDLHYDRKRQTRPIDAPNDTLRHARSACEELYAAVRGRGVNVEPFCDKWSNRQSIFKPVDERWENF